MSKIFKNIGKGKCIICGASKEGMAILIAKDESEEQLDSNIEECEVAHIECLDLRISKKVTTTRKLIYQKIKGE